VIRDDIELTTRHPSGVGFVPAHCQRGSLLGLHELTVLVHGYNVSEWQATDKWLTTAGNLRTLNGVPKGTVHLARFYWPGDHPWTARSKLSYFRKLPVAAEAGWSLATLLASSVRANDRLEIQFVGHSLGCKVVLEAAARLHGNTRVDVRNVLLMAAAVPEGLCETPRLYHVRTAATQSVLWSREDKTLRRVFRIGQLVARRFGEPPPGRNRQAVGLTGGPRFNGRWDRRPRCNLDHKDYWVKDAAIREISMVLGALPARVVDENQPLTHEPDEWKANERTTDRVHNIRFRSS